MEREALITYYGHSGFSVRLGHTLLIFDYWRGEGNRALGEREIDPAAWAKEDDVYVFVSHHHPDHFDDIVLTWRDVHPVTVVLADDIPTRPLCRCARPGQVLSLSDSVSVKIFRSTEVGVSYLVRAGETTVFHAGDLNLWHWRDKSTTREIERAETEFESVLSEMGDIRPDIAMFPLDPRQGTYYDAGINKFIFSTHPRLVLPMHFLDRAEVAREYARHNRTSRVSIVALTLPGEQLSAFFGEDSLRLQVLAAESVKPIGRQEVDPFADTDMPVVF